MMFTFKHKIKSHLKQKKYGSPYESALRENGGQGNNQN